MIQEFIRFKLILSAYHPNAIYRGIYYLIDFNIINELAQQLLIPLCEYNNNLVTLFSRKFLLKEF